MLTITGSITVTDNAGNNHTISCDDMNIQEVGTEEREMGTETTCEGQYEDTANGFSVMIEVYEYPVGACNHIEVTVDECTLVSHDIQGELTE